MWETLAALPLVVDGYVVERLEREPSFGHDRGTDLVRLQGRGETGLGEDITILMPEGSAAPELPLAGEWTFPPIDSA